MGLNEEGLHLHIKWRPNQWWGVIVEMVGFLFERISKVLCGLERLNYTIQRCLNDICMRLKIVITTLDNDFSFITTIFLLALIGVHRTSWFAFGFEVCARLCITPNGSVDQLITTPVLTDANTGDGKQHEPSEKQCRYGLKNFQAERK